MLIQLISSIARQIDLPDDELDVGIEWIVKHASESIEQFQRDQLLWYDRDMSLCRR